MMESSDLQDINMDFHEGEMNMKTVSWQLKLRVKGANNGMNVKS